MENQDPGRVELTPATGGRQSAKGGLEAQAGTSKVDGTQEESVTSRPKGESLPAGGRRDRGLSTKKTQGRGAPPGHRPPPELHPEFGAVKRGSCRRDDSHDPGKYGRRKVPTSGTSERRQGISPSRAMQAGAVTGRTWRRARSPPWEWCRPCSWRWHWWPPAGGLTRAGGHRKTSCSTH